MSSQWFYCRSDERYGPFSTDQLKQYAASRQLVPADLVWTEGMADWIPASKVSGLFAPPPPRRLTPPPPPIRLAPSIRDVSVAPAIADQSLSPDQEAASDTLLPHSASQQNQTASSLRFDWKTWNIGGKIIFASLCVAAVSMLVAWVDIGFASANGLSQGAFLFLILFVYPILMLLKSGPIHLFAGSACGAAGIVCSLWYIASKQVEIFGHSVNLASGGPYIFLLACIALIVGIVKYKPKMST